MGSDLYLRKFILTLFISLFVLIEASCTTKLIEMCADLCHRSCRSCSRWQAKLLPHASLWVSSAKLSQINSLLVCPSLSVYYRCLNCQLL